jgi:hypothetical protein
MGMEIATAEFFWRRILLSDLSFNGAKAPSLNYTYPLAKANGIQLNDQLSF